MPIDPALPMSTDPTSRLFERLTDLERQFAAFVRNAGVATNWHVLNASGEPTLLNSWTNYGGGYATAAFYRDADSLVHPRGMVTGGAVGSTIFILPEGYRPPVAEVFPVLSNNALGRIDVTSIGAVILSGIGSGAWVSLSGISFRAI